ncbi:hypothetical protein ACFFLM_13355 [Deinococcus oregonensis]|uniref:Uncharacterized protein n=1 Tax=Deinococcus oregonensis TaxID=1805970 RepID=A0ABV6AZN0_9DEIO
MRVLNISVSPRLLHQWADWLAPPVQPFFLTGAEATAFGLSTLTLAEWNPSPELRDTFALWNLSDAANRVALLAEVEWNGLSAPTRRHLLRLQIGYGRGNVAHARASADLLPEPQRGRFVWWPSLLTPDIVARAVSSESQACQCE